MQLARCLKLIKASDGIKHPIHSLTDTSIRTSLQHKALQLSQMERGYVNAMAILKFLIDKNPFDDWAHLRNIKLEVVADNVVNVCNAKNLVLKL